MKPKRGQWLFSSCAGEDYGQITHVGKDDNDTDIIDIRIRDPQELCHVQFNDKPSGEWPDPPLTRFELPPGASIVLRDVQYKMLPDQDGYGNQYIVCNTPVVGCYRCASLFALHDQPSEEWFRADLTEDAT